MKWGYQEKPQIKSTWRGVITLQRPPSRKLNRGLFWFGSGVDSVCLHSVLGQATKIGLVPQAIFPMSAPLQVRQCFCSWSQKYSIAVPLELHMHTTSPPSCSVRKVYIALCGPTVLSSFSTASDLERNPQQSQSFVFLPSSVANSPLDRSLVFSPFFLQKIFFSYYILISTTLQSLQHSIDFCFPTSLPPWLESYYLTLMPCSPGFKWCVSCRAIFPIMDGHVECIHCLGEEHIPQKRSHCLDLKPRARKDQEHQT